MCIRDRVYSRTKESAQGLAQTVEAAYTTELQAVTKEAQLYIDVYKRQGMEMRICEEVG